MCLGIVTPALPVSIVKSHAGTRQRFSASCCPRALLGAQCLVRGGYVGRAEMGPWSDVATRNDWCVVVVARRAAEARCAPWPRSRSPETRNLCSALRCGTALSSPAGAHVWWPFVALRPPTTSPIATGCRSARRPPPRSGFPTPCCSARCCVRGRAGGCCCSSPRFPIRFFSEVAAEVPLGMLVSTVAQRLFSRR